MCCGGVSRDLNDLVNNFNSSPASVTPALMRAANKIAQIQVRIKCYVVVAFSSADLLGRRQRTFCMWTSNAEGSSLLPSDCFDICQSLVFAVNRCLHSEPRASIGQRLLHGFCCGPVSQFMVVSSAPGSAGKTIQCPIEDG